MAKSHGEQECVEVPVETLRQVRAVMIEARSLCEHRGAKTKLRIWADIIKDHLPETLEKAKEKKL